MSNNPTSNNPSSNNSLSNNFNNALNWAKENYKKNPNGAPPTNWFVIVIVTLLVLICFAVYLKYFAVWGVQVQKYPAIPFSNKSLPTSQTPLTRNTDENSFAKPVFEVAPDGTTHIK